jgi:eukaryotic-like serine/threonine-protein kinase
LGAVSTPDQAGPQRSGRDAVGTVTGPTLVAGRRLGGRYEVTGLLARGGMAEVWEGFDDTLGRSVAVKILQNHLASDVVFKERFRREAVTAARLGHHNIVATYDAGIDAGTAFIVMELIRGRTLRQLLTSTGPLDPGLAVNIAMQVADALAYAHRCGLIHRDVKPANVLLCNEEDRVPLVKVTDFGIAKTTANLGQDLTATGMVLGTPKYFSPEQVEGKSEPDARSDLYSLGIVLFEMVAGRVPFDGPNEMATAVAHLREPPPSLLALRPGTPIEVDDLVQQLLAKAPGDRPPTAVATRQALDLLARDLASQRVRGRSRSGSHRAVPPAPSAHPNVAPQSTDYPLPMGSGRPGRDPLGAPALNGPVGVGGWTEAGRAPAAARSAGAGAAVRDHTPPDPNAYATWARGSRTTGSVPPVGTPSGGTPAPRLNGTKAPAPPRPESPAKPKPVKRKARRNGRVVALIIGAIVIAALVVGGILIGANGGKKGQKSVNAPPTLTPVKIVAVNVWMDNDRPPDNPGETKYTFDGNTSTEWQTVTYGCQVGKATFCGLYPGEGLAIQLQGSQKLVRLRVVSHTTGWAASTYVAATAPESGDNVDQWGTPTASKHDINGSTTFTLKGRTGQWVLLWLTNIGPTGQAGIGELTIDS